MVFYPYHFPFSFTQYFTELLESDVDTSSILSVFSSISHCLLEDPSPSLSTPQLANVLREMMASRHSPVRIAGRLIGSMTASAAIPQAVVLRRGLVLLSPLAEVPSLPYHVL